MSMSMLASSFFYRELLRSPRRCSRVTELSWGKLWKRNVFKRGRKTGTGGSDWMSDGSEFQRRDDPRISHKHHKQLNCNSLKASFSLVYLISFELYFINIDRDTLSSSIALFSKSGWIRISGQNFDWSQISAKTGFEFRYNSSAPAALSIANNTHVGLLPTQVTFLVTSSGSVHWGRS